MKCFPFYALQCATDITGSEKHFLFVYEEANSKNVQIFYAYFAMLNCPVTLCPNWVE